MLFMARDKTLLKTLKIENSEVVTFYVPTVVIPTMRFVTMISISYYQYRINRTVSSTINRTVSTVSYPLLPNGTWVL